MGDSIQQSLTRAILLLLRPLVRILLRNGVAYGHFADLAKKVYTDVAFEEFSLPGKKQTASRVAILTGLTRKEVKRLSEMETPSSEVEEKRYHRAIRVISGWLNDPRYSDAQGKPHALPLDGKASFSQLVRDYSGDVPVQAMLKELLAAESIEKRDDHIHLIKHAYIPSNDPIEKIHILGTDVRELISTIDHNLTHHGKELRFQRKVSNNNVSPETIEAFRKLSATEAQALLEQLDTWLTQHETESGQDSKESRKSRVCLGIYYFEEETSEEQEP